MEIEVGNFLKKNNIEFIAQYKDEWLRTTKTSFLTLDFYLPKYNIAIECQGKQHFGLGGWTNDEEKRQKEFELTQDRDKRKKELCEEHGVKLLYYLDKKYNKYIENKDVIINDIDEFTKFF